jgi:hypothetical protein
MHALLARRQRRQHARRGLAQIRLDRSIDGQDRVLVLDTEVSHVTILRLQHLLHNSTLHFCDAPLMVEFVEQLAM